MKILNFNNSFSIIYELNKKHAVSFFNFISFRWYDFFGKSYKKSFNPYERPTNLQMAGRISTGLAG